MRQIIWFIPLLPFIGFIIALLLGKRFGNIGAKLSTIILGVCILLSFYCVYLVYTGGSFSVGMNWFVTAKFSINFGMLADGLSAMMLVVVSIVSFLVHLYSVVTCMATADSGFSMLTFNFSAPQCWVLFLPTITSNYIFVGSLSGYVHTC